MVINFTFSSSFSGFMNVCKCNSINQIFKHLHNKSIKKYSLSAFALHIIITKGRAALGVARFVHCTDNAVLNVEYCWRTIFKIIIYIYSSCEGWEAWTHLRIESGRQHMLCFQIRVIAQHINNTNFYINGGRYKSRKEVGLF